MRMQRLKINALPNQSTKVKVKIINDLDEEKEVTFNLFFRYLQPCGYWTMDLKDNQNNPILLNVPLVTGGGYFNAGNLFQQMKYKNIGGFMVYKESETTLDYPDDEALGQEFSLIWVDEPTKYTPEGMM